MHNKMVSAKLSLWVTTLSFSIGTLLFLLYFFVSKSDTMLLIGLFFVLAAVVINLFVLFYLLIQLVLDIENQELNVIRILILLANIPIAALYLYLIFTQYSF